MRRMTKWKEMSSKQRIKRLLKSVIIIAVVIFLLIACDARLVTRNYTIYSDKVTAPVRLAIVADLHSCYYGADGRTLLFAVDDEEPDAVLLVGDVFDRKLSEDNAKTIVSALADQYPCYYVTGNHEYWDGRASEYKTWLQEQGVIVLSGECACATFNGVTINICGVDDSAYKGEDYLYEQIYQTLENEANHDLFTVLMVHRPDGADAYKTYDSDLIVCGHAHGGQVIIPYLVNGLYVPTQGLFPKYAGGRYDFENTTMIVSRGLARESSSIVPRVFNRPELVIIDIIPDEG